MNEKKIYLAGGCFWGVEKYLSLFSGVLKTKAGYSNGNSENPTYEQVCSHLTGHAETVEVTYNSNCISLNTLLDKFYQVIDPTSINRQGNDAGIQYRTGIYYIDQEDLSTIQASLEKLQKMYSNPLAIEVEPLQGFYPAEDYHQNYLDKNPGGYCHISPATLKEAEREKKEYLKSHLSDLQYQVTQESATEPPFHNEYYNEEKDGIYVDITTGEPLFTSKDKFESGCGWPSFTKPIEESKLTKQIDQSHGMIRTEVRNHSNQSHLGHVFSDGPQEYGGLRYCINSAALKFISINDMEKEGYGQYLYLFNH